GRRHGARRGQGAAGTLAPRPPRVLRLAAAGESVMIAIVDYGMGNLLSVYHALEMIGSEPKICTAPEELRDADRIILPGVGAFRDCIRNLRSKGFAEALNREVVDKGKPFLAICLGLQVLGRRSFEGGEYDGL